MKRRTTGLFEPATKGDLLQLEEKLEDKITGFKDDIMTRLDDISGQLETMRQENTIGSYQTHNLEEKVDDHEKRLKKLEHS